MFKVKGKRFKRDLRGKCSIQRVVRVWNELPEEVVEAGAVTAFKRHLDRYMDRKDLEGYGPNAESDQRNDSAHQELSQLTEMLAHEELRRRAAEEALIAAEEMLKGLDITAVRQTPREYTIQLESDEEREALIIDPSEQVVVRK
eukprot:g36286.t1